MKKEELSKKQLKIYDAIKKYIAKNKYPPTVRELCDMVNLNSTATVHFHISNLIKKGFLTQQKGGNRTLEVVGDNEYVETDENVAAIPLVGRVSCGNLIEAIEIKNNLFHVPINLIEKRHEVFALEVVGDSMINVGIYNKDIVLVERKKEAYNGEIVVVLDEEGFATIKRFYKEKDHIRLVPENDNYSDIILDNCEIIGKVIGLYRVF